MPNPMLQNLNDILKSSLTFMENKLGNKQISLQKRLTPNLPGLQVKTEEIYLVATNLLTNAVDSMPKGGELLVETQYCKEHNSCVQFSISDTGYGIKKNEIDKIFDCFFTTKGNIGLGLAISKELIEHYDGKIRVASSLGKGTTFTVCFPITEVKQGFHKHSLIA